MDRRFFISTAILGGMGFLGCKYSDSSNQNKTKTYNNDWSVFSKERLLSLLEELEEVYEENGIPVRKTLLPGIPEEELRKQCDWFPGELPEEVIALYGWSGGQLDETIFRFRDNSFCSIERGKKYYERIMPGYAQVSKHAEMLKYSFPVASFEGACYVIPAQGHVFETAAAKPVISVFEGVYPIYDSLEAMVKTQLDWMKNRLPYHFIADKQLTLEQGMERNKKIDSIWNSTNPMVRGDR